MMTSSGYNELKEITKKSTKTINEDEQQKWEVLLQFFYHLSVKTFCGPGFNCRCVQGINEGCSKLIMGVTTVPLKFNLRG